MTPIEVAAIAFASIISGALVGLTLGRVLTVLFGSFGLFAPRNGTTVGALLICALSIALSIFLILEMDDPFGGAMRVSEAPVRHALAEIDR